MAKRKSSGFSLQELQSITSQIKSWNLKIVEDPRHLSRILKDLSSVVSLDIETTGLYPWTSGAKVVSIGICTKTTQWVIPCLKEGFAQRIPGFLTALNSDLHDKTLVMHNGKFDCLWLKVHYGVNLNLTFDTMLAHYVIDENARHDLKTLAKEYFNAQDYDLSVDEKQGNVDFPILATYNALDCYYTRRLYFRLSERLRSDSGVHQVFHRILMPCSRLFVQAEYNGIDIDVDRMHEVEIELRRKAHKLKKQLDKWAPAVNWKSPQQVAKFFFEELKLKPLDMTPKGKPSTSESVLMRLAEKHPAARALIEYRGANQLLQTFIEGWKPFLVDNKLHPSFKLHGTVTGRLSCENPNLQQVPRDPLIRSLIISEPDWELLEVDLSQVELRIAAELANEKLMLQAFRDGIDIHWITALDNVEPTLLLEVAEKLTKRKLDFDEAKNYLLKIGIDAVTDKFPEWKEIRKKAKAINFGYLYGMWWKKFLIYARDNYGVTVTPQQAQASRETYFKRFPQLAPWHNRQRMFARRNGYVVSLSGRKRRLPAATSPYDSPERGEAERQAINSPVQSFANDLNLMAALEIHRKFPFDVKICGTVHDAILMKVRKMALHNVVPRVLQIMSHPELLDELGIKLTVPLEAEAKLGPWGKGISPEKYFKLNPPL